MVVYYTIFGRQVASHVLSIATLSATFGGIAFAMAGGSKKSTQTPPINAASDDEADFIKKFMDNAEAEEKKTAKH